MMIHARQRPLREAFTRYSIVMAIAAAEKKRKPQAEIAELRKLLARFEAKRRHFVRTSLVDSETA